jgi:hypothetical protein
MLYRFTRAGLTRSPSISMPAPAKPLLVGRPRCGGPGPVQAWMGWAGRRQPDRCGALPRCVQGQALDAEFRHSPAGPARYGHDVPRPWWRLSDWPDVQRVRYRPGGRNGPEEGLRRVARQSRTCTARGRGFRQPQVSRDQLTICRACVGSSVACMYPPVPGRHCQHHQQHSHQQCDARGEPHQRTPAPGAVLHHPRDRAHGRNRRDGLEQDREIGERHAQYLRTLLLWSGPAGCPDAPPAGFGVRRIRSV